MRDDALALARVEDLLGVGEVRARRSGEAGHGDGEAVIATARGDVAVRVQDATPADAGVVWVGGVGGGFDSPAAGLYPRLGALLRERRVGSVQVRFRHPGDLQESVFDCLAGLWLLRTQDVTRAAAVGHSFGGAVVVQAAAVDPTVRTLVTLATQAYGTDPVVDLGDRCSLLAVHGSADEVLPDACSRQVVSIHPGRHRLVVLDGAGHVLDEVADEVDEVVLDWLVTELRPG